MTKGEPVSGSRPGGPVRLDGAVPEYVTSVLERGRQAAAPFLDRHEAASAPVPAGDAVTVGCACGGSWSVPAARGGHVLAEALEAARLAHVLRAESRRDQR